MRHFLRLPGWWLSALLLALAPLLSRAEAAWPAPLVLHDTAQVYSVGLHWALLADPRPAGVAAAQPFTLAQVRAAPLSEQFVPSRENVPNRGNDNADFWLRCQVRNTAHPSTVWLLAGTALIEPFEVYVVTPDGRTRRYLDNRSATWQPPHIVPARFSNLRLTLPPGQTCTIYLHSWGDIFKFSFNEQTQFTKTTREGDIVAFLYFGLLLGLVAYNLLLYFSVRDPGYLYYVLFTTSFGTIQLDMMGYRAQYLPWLDTLVPFGFQDLVLSATLVFSILTAQAFLETKRQAPRYLDRLLLLTIPVAMLPTLLAVYQYLFGLPNVLRPLYTFAPLIVGAVLLFAGMRQLLHGYRPARYYIAGWGLLIVAVVIFYMRSLGLIPVSFLTEQGVRIASAIEVILLSLGLADRINRARQERQQAQQQALAALSEKEEVQRSANDALRQRADELQQAYADLRTSLETTDRLQEVDELKTRFFTGISHELRTPLTLILGPLEQVMRHPEAAPLATEHQLMHRHGQRLLMLINQLLDIARLEAGQMQLQACETDLSVFTNTIVESFQPSAAAKNVQLTARLTPGISAYVDRDQLEKVLTNLLGNALKFTDSGGAIEVTMSPEDDEAVLAVTDTGCGIAPGHLARVFDRFYQADGSTRRRHDGSGIGLALVKELVALHHGTVTAVSEVDRGSSFTLRLPLGKAHLAAEEIVPAPAVGLEKLVLQSVSPEIERAIPAVASAPETADDQRPLVLVVDDHDDMRAYVATCLGTDYRVLQASDGHAALAQAQATLPDLILTDLMMPVMDGLELCRRFKTDERTSHIPVVMLTARASDESRLEGLELGADDYLIKPFRPAELRARVTNLIRQRQQLREQFGREVTLQPRDISITSADETFLTRALDIVETHLADADFDVETFASAMAMSRVQLFRKLKALTDQAPTDFVRVLRLRRAAQLLAAQSGTVADIAYGVGFNSLSYFGKCFREQYGHAPSEHAALATSASV